MYPFDITGLERVKKVCSLIEKMTFVNNNLSIFNTVSCNLYAFGPLHCTRIVLPALAASLCYAYNILIIRKSAFILEYSFSFGNRRR